MAGDWIKVEKSTPTKGEILRLSSILKLHPDHAFGLCFRFWSWCDDNAKDGLVHIDSVTLDALLGVTGFANALVTVGWLRNENGALEIPNFERHMSQSAKSRMSNAERQKKFRDKKNSNGGVTEKRYESNKKSLPEKRREEKSIEENTPLPPKPAVDPHAIAQSIVNAWNVTPGVVQCRSVTEKRIHAVAVRTRDPSWNWEAALAKFPLKCFQTDNDSNWKPDFDWFLRPDSVLKILEGKYDWQKKAPAASRSGIPRENESAMNSLLGKLYPEEFDEQTRNGEPVATRYLPCDPVQSRHN